MSDINGIIEEQVDDQLEAKEVDKHDKFQEQGAILVRKAVAAIENVGKVANQKNYEYSEAEVEKMFAALEESIADTRHLFKKKRDFSWE